MELTGLELRLSCELSRNGYALCDVAEFCRDASLMVPLLTLSHSFANGDKVAGVKSDVSRGILRQTFKPFVVKYQEQQEFASNHPLYRFGALPSVRRVIDEAVGVPMRFMSADLWYVLPNSDMAERGYGSSWHRDPEDRHTVKVYLFLTDVDEESGAIEYVVGSHRADSKYASIGKPQRYAPQEAVEAIPEIDKRRFECPAGTLLFFHSGGLHRGSYTMGRSRLNTVWTYVPEAAPIPNNFTLIEHDRSSHHFESVAV